MLISWLMAILFLQAPVSNTNSNSNHLSAQQADSLTVYVFLLDDCVISQYYTPALSNFYGTYKSQKVGFIGCFPSTKPEQIEAFGKKYQLSFPLKQDYYKDWTKKMGVTVTPEVAVWDHRTERLIYRGRIDDSYVRVGKRKFHPKSHDLKNIIDQWLLNQAPDTLVQTQAIGCFISLK
jgi:peroxiredoxin